MRNATFSHTLELNSLRQASVTTWFPSSHSSPCCGCTFPSPHVPTPSGTFSVDWNGWNGWKICQKTITVGAKLCEGPKIYLTSRSEDKTKLNPPSEDGWRNTHPLVNEHSARCYLDGLPSFLVSEVERPLVLPEGDGVVKM